MEDNDKLLYANSLDEKSGELISSECNPTQSNSTQSNPTQPNPESNEVFNELIENQLIDALIKHKSKEDLKDIKFFIMSSNIQLKIKDEYRPLEIGIIEYTIRDGIRLNYQQFIDCGEVPTGYAFEAMDNMERTHKIPLKDFNESSNNYLLIGSQILKILSDSFVDEEISYHFGRPLIVFSKTEQINQNEGSLKWIEKKFNEMREQRGLPVFKFNINVLNCSSLLSSLFEAAGDYRSIIWCQNAITSPSFDYSPNTDCPYHESKECIDCALGIPKRMAYLMSHLLRELYGIRLTSSHLPSHYGIEVIRIEEEKEVPLKLAQHLEKGVEFKHESKEDKENQNKTEEKEIKRTEEGIRRLKVDPLDVNTFSEESFDSFTLKDDITEKSEEVNNPLKDESILKDEKTNKTEVKDNGLNKEEPKQSSEEPIAQNMCPPLDTNLFIGIGRGKRLIKGSNN